MTRGQMNYIFIEEGYTINDVHSFSLTKGGNLFVQRFQNVVLDHDHELVIGVHASGQKEYVTYNSIDGIMMRGNPMDSLP
jgi:hypothetical protein